MFSQVCGNGSVTSRHSENIVNLYSLDRLANTSPPTQPQDARQTQTSYLGEIAKHVCSFAVPLGQHVEEERLHVKVQSLVLQEELCHEAQVLAVHLVLLPIYLEERQPLVSVDLVARGMTPGADFLCGYASAGSKHIIITKATKK